MADYTLILAFNANGGSGAPSNVSRTTSSTGSQVTVTAKIPSTTPTRTGYTFGGWSGNGSTYQPNANVSNVFTRQFDDQGNIINQSKSIYFTAAWRVQSSSWGTTPTSVSLDGSTSYTFNISNVSTVDHHTVTFALGSETLTYTNVGTSVAVTFPTTWQAQIPNATSGSITCTLTSLNANDVQIGGNATKTITGNVPSSVVPTLTLSHQAINSNSTIAGWGVLVQGFSKIKFTATAAGAGGSSIASIEYSGAGLQKSGTATTATSETLVVNGWQTWTVIATDTRGRTATETYSEIVYEYSPPRLSSMEIYRCDSDGTPNAASGTYCLFTAHYGISRCGGNNSSSVRAVESKLNTASTWTTVCSPYTVDTSVVLSGTYDVDKIYNIRFTVTDALGNTIQETANLTTVAGFAYGLKNDRARFGGVPNKAGLQIDWDTYITGKLTIGNGVSFAEFDIAGNATTSVAFANLAHGLVVLSGSGSKKEMLIVNSTSAGSVSSVSVTNNSNYTVTTSTNTLTIANGTSSKAFGLVIYF